MGFSGIPVTLSNLTLNPRMQASLVEPTSEGNVWSEPRLGYKSFPSATRNEGSDTDGALKSHSPD